MYGPGVAGMGHSGFDDDSPWELVNSSAPTDIDDDDHDADAGCAADAAEAWLSPDSVLFPALVVVIRVETFLFTRTDLTPSKYRKARKSCLVAMGQRTYRQGHTHSD